MPIFSLKLSDQKTATSSKQMKEALASTSSQDGVLTPSVFNRESAPAINRTGSSNSKQSETSSNVTSPFSTQIMTTSFEQHNASFNTEESVEGAKRAVLKEFMNGYMNALVDEVCVYEFLEQSGGVSSSNYERKRLVPAVWSPEENNLILLDEKFQLVNEMDKKNGRFGWFFNFYYLN